MARRAAVAHNWRMSDEWSALKREARWIVRLLGVPLAVMWLVQLVNLFTMNALLRFGVQPRTVAGLVGILFMPFLHGGFLHLLANTVPWIVAGGLIVAASLTDFVVVTISSWLLGGLGAWLIGASGSNHVGASGIVFGFFGYLLVNGWLKKSALGIAVSVGFASFYGVGIVLGALPTQTGISWEGHAFGLLGGVLATFGLARARRRPALTPPRR